MPALEAQQPLLENCSTSSPSRTNSEHLPQRDSKAIWKRHWWLAQGCLLLLSISLTIYNIKVLSTATAGNPPIQATFSPALDDLGEYSRTIRFNGSIFAPSPYKGDPATPEVDAAWASEIYHGVFSITHDTLRKIEASEDSVKLPPEHGGGYMAMLEVFHQIHCVRYLWEATYPVQHAQIANSTATYRDHLDHCADILRQKLMCDGDLGVISYNWVKHLSHPTPNFNTVHQCRDFEAIKRWAKSNALLDLGDGFEKPVDAVELDDFP